MKIIKVLYLAFLFSTLHCLVIQSQSINALFNDSSLNYYQVRNLGYNNSEIIKQSDPREIKSFQRWDMYWKNRYDSKEGYEKIANVMREHLLKQTGSISQKIQKSDSTIFASKKSSIINSSFQESSLMYDNNQVCIPIGPESTPSSICSGSYNPTGIGRVESIWANSSLSSTIYAGGSNGGLWKKTYTGEWECLTDDLYSFGVMDIAVHPTNSNKIYIATGCMVASGSSLYNGGYGLGIFSSSDGGNTWSSGPFSEPEFDGFVRKIVIDPVSPNILYALSRKKLYKSTDGGASWDYMNNPYSVETEFIDLAISPSDHNIIYICARTNEIYCSTNGGSSWSSNLADNLTEPSTKVRMGIAVTPAQGNALFAVYMRGSYAYLDKSTDNGNTWVNLAADYVYAGNHTPLRLAISPTDINNIYVGGISFYKYSSTSSSFVLKSASNMSPPNYLHSDIRKILVVDDGNGSDIVYVGTDGGIAVSYDETSSWSYIEEGLQMGLFYSLSSSDADPGTLVGGTHDCSSHIFSNNSWQNTSCLHCDGGSSLVKDDNSNHMFIQCNGSIYRSLDGGTNWSSIGESSTEYDCPIIEDPSNGNTIYVGSNWNPKVSYDNGSSFQTLATLGDDRTTNIAVSASNPNVLYYARANYICRSDGTCRYNKTWLIRRSDDGSSWIDLSNELEIFRDLRITGIAISPNNSNYVWITLGGLTDGEKVYYTNNGGTSWTNISANLENFPVQCIIYDDVNNKIMIGTDLGVYYRSPYSSGSWHRLNDLPYTTVTGLSMNNTSGDIFISTYGRGIWKTSAEGYCYDPTANPMQIYNVETFDTDFTLCGDIEIFSGGKFILTANMAIPLEGHILVKSGGELVIDGGTIKNCNVIVEDGGSFVIKNDGIAILKTGDNIDVSQGGVLDITYGGAILE